MTQAAAPRPLLQCGIWPSACGGQEYSGDLHLVAGYDRGMLVAVVGGCGQGPEVAAARAAVTTLREHPELDVVELMRRCVRHLRVARGAVVALASFHGRDNLLTWVGAGNVDARLWSTGNAAAKTLPMRTGAAGYTPPRLQAMATTVAPGDLLLVATDGMHGSLSGRLDTRGEPREIAERIGAQGARGSGLVLVARYLGWPK